ncbi:molybdenum cofactor biosynthesis protein MoaE [Actinospongicola halichondriae]|uniref:molybdenum cofactor biosynthesis protein MoaE n=1 Tax=Actinospongicola halichondriae TaxID=3236844 RepID=UPI003D4C8053
MTSPDMLAPPAHGDDWLGLSSTSLPVHDASSWAERADCGGVVTFTGNARDHSTGRPGVDALEYEAYETQVVPRLERIAAEARTRWDDVGRIVMLHRTGPLAVGEAAVVVVVSAPHRDEAFAAARFCIDTLKATVPIWKKERWDGGSSWGLEAQHLLEPEHVGDAS